MISGFLYPLSTKKGWIKIQPFYKIFEEILLQLEAYSS